MTDHFMTDHFMTDHFMTDHIDDDLVTIRHELSAVGRRLLATALAGQLAAVTVLVLVLLATGAGP